LVENCGGHLARIELKNLKPESLKIKPTDPIEEGQHILASIIASAYLRSKKDSHTEIQLDKTKNK
jgi:hypothetical protein